MDYLVKYNKQRISGEIRLPGSKSHANRLLLIRELSGSRETIEDLPESEDTQLMTSLLETIRAVKGGQSTSFVKLDCHNAGTVFRFLTTFLSITPGKWLLTGNRRMKERPVGVLADALIELGASIEYAEKKGYPPLRIEGKPLSGGSVHIQSHESSQYISSLLMSGPYFEKGLRIHLSAAPVSKPYIELTLEVMRNNGIIINVLEDGYFIEPQTYHFSHQAVESDWSSASCWYETVALSDKGELLLGGLRADSLQGDRALADIYQRLGVESEFRPEGVFIRKSRQAEKTLEIDLSSAPDLVPSLAAAMAGLKMSGVISGIGHLRIKESDRLECIRQELSKAGYLIDIEDNNLIFKTLPNNFQGRPKLSSHNDHRITMAMAPLALKINELIIDRPEAVHKSYPGFWQDMQKIGFQVIEV